MHIPLPSDNDPAGAASGARLDLRAPAFSRLWAIFVVGLAILAVLAWTVSDRLAQQRAENLLLREWDRTLSLAGTIDARLGMLLVRTRSVPNVLAQESQIVAALQREGADVVPNGVSIDAYRQRLDADPRLRALEQRLEIMVREFHVDQIWVVNAAGDCIASGGFAPDARATGINYADREYFKLAMVGHIGRQSAVGRTTDVLSVYYAAPVTVGGRMLGVVVVKIEARQLSALLPDRGAFVTDELGVVVAAADPGLLLKVLPGQKAATQTRAELLARYKRATLEALPYTAAKTPFAPLPGAVASAGAVRVEGSEALHLLARSASQADFLQVWVAREAPEVMRLRRDGVGAFALMLLAGASLWAVMLLGWAYHRRGQQFRAEIGRANVELVKLNEELRVQARFDALTRCANRAYFLSELETAMRRAQRAERPCSLAVLDLDHFKSINDRYGHAAGDDVLVCFVRRAGAMLRSTDLLGRLGGEEFAVLMPDTGCMGALELAERLRAGVDAEVCMAADLEIPISVSIGVAEWRGKGESSEDFLARADAAMYVAKRGGRNRVVGADD